MALSCSTPVNFLLQSSGHLRLMTPQRTVLQSIRDNAAAVTFRRGCHYPVPSRPPRAFVTSLPSPALILLTFCPTRRILPNRNRRDAVAWR